MATDVTQCEQVQAEYQSQHHGRQFRAVNVLAVRSADLGQHVQQQRPLEVLLRSAIVEHDLGARQRSDIGGGQRRLPSGRPDQGNRLRQGGQRREHQSSEDQGFHEDASSFGVLSSGAKAFV